jgi:hypothetical protein
MRIVRDDEMIGRRRRIGQVASLVGLGILAAGMAVVFFGPQWGIPVDVAVWVPLGTLIVGFVLSQIGLYFTNRWGRRPRPDQLVDQNLKGLGKEYKMYHYVLPAPHVLLTPEGPLVIVVRLDAGVITARGDRWRQKMSAWRVLTFLGREGLGNPTREAQYQVQQVQRLISERAQELVDAPVDGVIAFLAERVTLDVEEAPVPVVRGAKLKGYLRSRPGKALPRSTYQALEALFDSIGGLETQED